jgi:hypothetical protein
MKGPSKTLSSAIDWLLAECEHTAYGRLSIGIQLHEGRIAKVFKSIEETTLAPQGGKVRFEDGSR